MSKACTSIYHAAAALLAMLAPWNAEADVLWWWVNDTAQVDSAGLYSFVTSYGIDAYVDQSTGTVHAYCNAGARAAAMFKDGQCEVLPIVYPDFPGERFYFTELFDEQSAGHQVSSGNWTTQSPLKADGISELALRRKTMRT